MAKKDKNKVDETPVVDLAARIGTRSYEPPPPPPAASPEAPLRLDGPLPPRRDARPVMIGMDEPAPPPLKTTAAHEEASGDEEAKSSAIPSPRTAPGPNEMDVVITPLPTPEDWHRFELALRKVPGIWHGEGQVKTEYYRHGVLKIRVTYAGEQGLANALRAGVPGFRVRVIGEDRATIQLLIAGEGEDRRPG